MFVKCDKKNAIIIDKYIDKYKYRIKSVYWVTDLKNIIQFLKKYIKFFPGVSYKDVTQ